MEKTKARVQKNVEDIAEELLKLYQERERIEGYQFGPDTEEQENFEMDFPYEPTHDQKQSLIEIKGDMEKVSRWIVCYVEMLDTVKRKSQSARHLKLLWMGNKLRSWYLQLS